MTRAYDSRGQTLDPGLTAIALRAKAEPGGHYPFVHRVLGWRARMRLWGRRRQPAPRRA